MSIILVGALILPKLLFWMLKGFMENFVGSFFLIILAFIKGTATSSYDVGGELLAAWTDLEVFVCEKVVQCWSEFSSSLRALLGQQQKKIDMDEGTKPIANLLHILYHPYHPNRCGELSESRCQAK